MVKGYVDSESKTVFVCPNCGFEKHFDASPFRNRKKKISVKCKCGTPSEMTIEFRQHFRKDVELHGTCLVKKINKLCNIVIKNISRSGLRVDYFIVDRKNMSILELGDVVIVEFKLDDRKKKLISKKCAVRLKMDGWIGVEFMDNDYEQDIGFYLW